MVKFWGVFEMGVVIATILFCHFFIKAQEVVQREAFEIETNPFDSFMPLVLAEKGIVLLHTNGKQYHIVKLDKNLKTNFELHFDLDRVMVYGRHFLADDTLFILMIDKFYSPKQVIVLQFNLLTKQLIKIRPALLKKEFLTDFIVDNKRLIFRGTFKDEAIINIQNIGSEMPDLRLVSFPPKSILYDVRSFTDSSFVSITTNDDKRFLVLDEINLKGKKVRHQKIELGSNKKIFTAIMEKSKEGAMIVGMWSIHGSLKPNGLFILSLRNFEKASEDLKIYSFSELDHFLDFLSYKKLNHVREKEKHEKEQGGVPNFKLKIYPVRLTQSSEGFDFFCCTYKAKGGLNAEILSAAVIKINFDGSIRNVVQATPGSLYTYSISNVTDFCNLLGRSLFFFCQKDELTVVSKDKDNQTQMREVIKFNGSSEQKQVREEFRIIAIAYWYDYSFCSQGYKFTKDAATGSTKQYYFINKLVGREK
ncbi:MAG: hypothetical protein QM734_02995 [Cyclobacteriaceae bacterium]